MFNTAINLCILYKHFFRYSQNFNICLTCHGSIAGRGPCMMPQPCTDCRWLSLTNAPLLLLVLMVPHCGHYCCQCQTPELRLPVALPVDNDGNLLPSLPPLSSVHCDFPKVMVMMMENVWLTLFPLIKPNPLRSSAPSAIWVGSAIPRIDLCDATCCGLGIIPLQQEEREDLLKYSTALDLSFWVQFLCHSVV